MPEALSEIRSGSKLLCISKYVKLENKQSALKIQWWNRHKYFHSKGRKWKKWGVTCLKAFWKTTGRTPPGYKAWKFSSLMHTSFFAFIFFLLMISNTYFQWIFSWACDFRNLTFFCCILLYTFGTMCQTFLLIQNSQEPCESNMYMSQEFTSLDQRLFQNPSWITLSLQ